MKNTNSTEVRRDVVEKMKQEFDMVHERIMGSVTNPNEDHICELVRTQISLAMHIVREERDLNGKGAYAFPPYTPQ